MTTWKREPSDGAGPASSPFISSRSRIAAIRAIEFWALSLGDWQALNVEMVLECLQGRGVQGKAGAKMKGHIRERSPGHCAVVLEVRDPESGTRKRKWHSFRGTKREAQTECSRLTTEFAQGSCIEPSKTTLAIVSRQMA
jgi:hypothetical protein